MNKELHNILSEFKTMKEYTDFMGALVEKKADGNEISRGMNKHDKSKDQKKDDAPQTFLSKKVSKGADGSAEEEHFDQHDPSVGAEPPPPPPVPLEPGQQVKIGNKQVDPSKVEPETVKISLSGKKEKLVTKPRLSKNPTNVR